MDAKFCIYPLTTLNLTWPKLYPCCSSSLSLVQRLTLEIDPTTVLDEVWNDQRWARWRQRIASDDYVSCVHCQQKADFVTESELKERYPEIAEDIIAYRKGAYERLPYPHTLILSFDTTCNLSCVTCRPRGIQLMAADTDAITANLSDYITHAKRVVIAGEGEVAISPSYRRILNGLTDGQKITIMSNGTRLNEEFWGSLPQAVIDNIDRVHISCDGTTKQVYESIRLGGNFDTWLDNMDLLHKMKSSNHWTTKMMYTVSKSNYEEMRSVPTFARTIGFDELYMAPAAQWSRKLKDSSVWITEAQLDERKLKIANIVCESLMKEYKKTAEGSRRP